MKKITLCLMLIVALIIPVAVLATEPVVDTTTVESVSTEAELREALEAGKSVELEGDIELTSKTNKEGYEGRNAALVIDGEGSITINGNGHTISLDAARTIFEVYATGTEKLNVTFDNVKLEANAAGGRCINTYTGNITLNINNSSLKTTNGSYDQALTIGGDSASNIEININNSNITAESHYAIIAFNPVKMTINGCKTIGGFTSLYMKEGSSGSEININNSELLGRNKWAAASGTFGTIVLEDENIKIDVENSNITAIEEDTALEYIIQDKVGGNTITARKTTINAATTSMSIKSSTQIILGDQTVLKDSSIPGVDILSSFLATGAVAKLTAENEYTVYEPHTITVKEVEGGKVTASAEKALIDEIIKLNVTVNAGYKLVGIDVITDNGMEDVSEELEFSMRNLDVTIVPKFEAVPHTITIKEVEGGKVTANKETAVVGEKITLTVTVKEGYKLEKIEIEEGDTLIGETTFEMYPNDITVTPVFVKLTQEAEVPNEVANEKETEEMLVETLKETIAQNSTLAEKIEGKNIEVEVKVNQENITVTESEKTKIETEVAKEVKDIKVAKYIGITIVVKDADAKTEIDTLEKVKEDITFTVAIPEDIPTVAEGYTRTYYIVRNHNGEVKILDTKVSEDGKTLEFASNLFSTYAIAYSDVKDEPTVTPPTTGEGETEQQPVIPDVPKTGDNIVVYAVLAVVAMAGIVVTIKMRKK